MQPIEEIFSILDSEGCNPEYIPPDPPNLFSRDIKFTALGITYYIEWWANIGYLHVGNMYASYFPFRELITNTTWPNCTRGLKFNERNYYFIVATKMLDWQRDKIQEVA